MPKHYPGPGQQQERQLRALVIQHTPAAMSAVMAYASANWGESLPDDYSKQVYHQVVKPFVASHHITNTFFAQMLTDVLCEKYLAVYKAAKQDLEKSE
jgi:hypothetical protein